MEWSFRCSTRVQNASAFWTSAFASVSVTTWVESESRLVRVRRHVSQKLARGVTRSQGTL